MKTVVLLLVTFTVLPVHSEILSESYCFSSGEINPTRFELRTYNDVSSKWSGAFVKYERSKNLISLVHDYTSVEGGGKDHPAQSIDKWLEVSGKKISGQYEMLSQGATVYSMTYINNVTHKKFYFNLDPNVVSSVGTGCEW